MVKLSEFTVTPRFVNIPASEAKLKEMDSIIVCPGYRSMRTMSFSGLAVVA